MFTHSRESWQNPSQPVTGPAFPGWAKYTDVAIHYTSAAKIPADIDAYHRAMQNDYLTSRGFSLGYTCSVDQQRGGSREIRGLDFKPAATRNANDFALAILVLVDGNDMATPQACAEVRRIIGWWESLAGRHLTIKGHGEYVATGCPGSGLRAQIAIGEFSPRWNAPAPVPPPVFPPPVLPPTIPEDDPMFYLTSPTPGVRPDVIWFAGRVYGISSVADAEQFLAGGATRLNLSVDQFDLIVGRG